MYSSIIRLITSEFPVLALFTIGNRSYFVSTGNIVFLIYFVEKERDRERENYNKISNDANLRALINVLLNY